jgi:hypothetical protein
VERLLTTARPAAPQGATIEQRTPERGAASGIAFVPTQSVDVVFREVQRAGTIRITLGDSPALRVMHTEGVAGYTLTGSGVAVDNAHSGADYQIIIPRSAPLVRIRAGDREVFTKRGAHIAAAVAPDRGGVYEIAFAQLGGRSQ